MIFFYERVYIKSWKFVKFKKEGVNSTPGCINNRFF